MLADEDPLDAREGQLEEPELCQMSQEPRRRVQLDNDGDALLLKRGRFTAITRESESEDTDQREFVAIPAVAPTQRDTRSSIVQVTRP